MLSLKKVAHLQHHLKYRRNELLRIGFVPTMGALHEGHLSLIQRAAHLCDYVVCSIFVNPTQFNDPNDLQRYPRTPAEDIDKLCQTPCNVLFMPSVEEIYPEGWQSDAPPIPEHLLSGMEGKYRPGHFDGVVKVVKRLLDIVQPDMLFMGQKDFQQFTIVNEMVHQLNLPVEVVCCETIREPDGLAMSSRNLLLSPQERECATAIYRALRFALDNQGAYTPAQVKQRAFEMIEQAGLKAEYFQIVDGRTLQPIENWDDSDFIVACTAAYAGNIRLIDNLILRQPNH